jgi:SAM-dependent methyltransferase
MPRPPRRGLPAPPPRKRLGQHFLSDPRILDRIADALELRGHETVVEIGPGRGALTEALRQRAGRVVAVELDRELAALLRDRYANDPRVTVVEADVLDVPLASELADFAIAARPRRTTTWSDLPGATLAWRRAGVLPSTPVMLYDDLRVTDASGKAVSVGWRAEPAADHISAGDAAAAGRALAWRVGRWHMRASLSEAFAAARDDVEGSPSTGGRAALLAAEDDFDAIG